MAFVILTSVFGEMEPSVSFPVFTILLFFFHFASHFQYQPSEAYEKKIAKVISTKAIFEILEQSCTSTITNS